ncbi:uroplakin-2 isoform X2 [Heterocephalus glaber]|uniref:Uroplakin-2 n=2 Tax=Heterocephalus glaber TaxID=10181 RepID=A0A0P6J6M2_HETGA|nr:uroplakin-2 isoform X2 [Heterocephalus glaber]
MPQVKWQKSTVLQGRPPSPGEATPTKLGPDTHIYTGTLPHPWRPRRRVKTSYPGGRASLALGAPACQQLFQVLAQPSMASLLPVHTLPLMLILLAILAPGAAEFNISNLSGLLSPALAESLLVALPPCHLTGGNATLMVRRANDSKVVNSSFVVPPCRGRRELVSVMDSGAGFTVTRLSAYQVTNLHPGTKYYISYQVQKGSSTESSQEIPMSTLPQRNMESIGLGMARTGGMVVITVLLSISMFVLVVGLIITLALGTRK